MTARVFARYDVADHLAAPADHVAAWLTGQSSFRHSRLSPEQDAVLDGVERLGYATVRCGFPWNAAALREPYRREPILPASARNAAQFAAARLGTGHGQEVARHLQPVVDAASRRLLLICGSAGAELLTAALPHLRLDARPVLAVALGPVGRLPGPGDGVRVHVVRGAGDRLSRWGCSDRSHAVVPGGHLDYARSTAVRAEVERVAAEFLA